MKVTIEIDCDNSAFQDNIAGELGRILSTVPPKVQRRMGESPISTRTGEVLRDINGNTVGLFVVDMEEGDE